MTSPKNPLATRHLILSMFADEDYQAVASFRAPYDDRSLAPRIHVGYRDAAGDYAGVIVFRGQGSWTFHGIRPPASLSEAVDSDATLRHVAIAACQLGGVSWDKDMPCDPPSEDLQDQVFCFPGMGDDPAAELVKVTPRRPFFQE